MGHMWENQVLLTDGPVVEKNFYAQKVSNKVFEFLGNLPHFT